MPSVISAFVSTSSSPDVPMLSADLESVGIHVLGVAAPGAMVENVIRSEADLVVCYEDHPDDALFASTTTLSAVAPRPVVVFTVDCDAEKIERAIRSGIHAYVVNGYGLNRLRSIIHMAQSRFRYDKSLRDELSDISSRFDERKLIDRAKGILMRARQVSEDEAFRVLRTLAMQSKQRIGKVSQQVIDSARYAEAVNRAGQLRMLSQRLVRLYALQCLEINPAETTALFTDSIERTDNNLTILSKSLSKPTFGDLFDAVSAAWLQLKAALRISPDIKRIAEIDRLAEKLLVQSEQLTVSLETAGIATTLHVVNVSGRQRMLSQRLAKQALLDAMLKGDSAEAPRIAARATEEAFIESMGYLNAIPLSSREIRDDLESAAQVWQSFCDALRRSSKAGQSEIAYASELLLAHFDRLTDHYERSMQVLTG